MNSVISISARQIGDASVQTVNGRELHAFLEVATRYNDWIKNRVDQYDFVDGIDFTTLTENLVGGGSQKNHFLSLDMAKELAMVERNENGKKARQYFIECERRAKAAPAIDPMKVLNDPAAMRGLLLGYTERVLALETVVANQAPKVEAFDRIATSDGSLCITDAAKTLQIPPRKLTQILQEHKYIYRRPMGSGWLAYQDRIQQGLMEHKVTTGEKSDGSEWTGTQARITPKGLTKLAEVFRQAGLH